MCHVENVNGVASRSTICSPIKGNEIEASPVSPTVNHTGDRVAAQNADVWDRRTCSDERE
jgi:hypothetical protein